ncbi:IS1341-type transposase ISNma23 (plasmid) [Natrialba magadii ATCC 43099]|uniref:IS1341-type transposase ISNma23 n=1 Tax=Natrialba magadii (strain ATCC 43099 / DSM 3394 / CCM 3739 / CIP 104546 / IAM 13178 / JCM 8861 / NBRC 102185 / NCIMB 2190 / MS3) TaxID=547559 RepID=D3T1Z3_NATMM|nr:RNA-guided endonuclease TnpB family protein [Natrialba magadii]ADD07602.1 IS1341-type transposase ISNma23 [Natrialba magadii ATCC 43099]ELY27077.1 transposase, IS605 OrfB family protein [Natrialba magadii ATCC 43099]
MKRANRFNVRPRSAKEREVFVRWLDASASLWNETNYTRRQNFLEDDESIWDADTGSLEGKYKGVLSSSVAQQIIRKNSEAWRSFLSLNEKYHAGKLNEKPSPPGYWGSKDDGRVLRTYVRNDQYTIEYGERSRLEVPIGSELKDELGLNRNQRLRVEVAGEPKWSGEQNRLEIVYDETADTFRAFQPVTVPDSRLDSPLASHEAALDVGVNNLVACTTTTGFQFLFEGRNLFEQFRKTTERIAHYQSLLENQRESSKRIDRLYRKRTNRRNHAQDTLVRELTERLYDEGVSTLYVGDIKGVLSTHWSPCVNEKTHNFWAYRRFINRLEDVCEEYGITVNEVSEAWTTQMCPECGEHKGTIRHEDSLACPCGFEGHADLVASESFLRRQNTEVGSMARPVYLKWNNHNWREHHNPPSLVETTANEAYTDQSTTVGGNVAVGESQDD